jgi:hypothetical protein
MPLEPFAALGLLVILAACTETQGRTTRVFAFYSPSLASYVARDGTFPMVVRGSPFAAPVAAQAIRDAVAVPRFAGGGRFVENAAAEPGTGLRLVVVFNPADARLGFREMCGDLSGVATAAPNGAIHIRTAFCRANESITDASVRGAAGAVSADDPAFRTLLDGAVKRALPFFGGQRPTIPGFN